MSESLGDLRGTIGFDVDTKTLRQLVRELGNVEGASNDLTGSMEGQDRASRSLSAAQQGLRVGATAVAAGIAAAGAAIGVATQAATEYDAAMTEVATLTPDVANNMAQFKEEVLGVSAALGQDAVTATNGLYNAISAGIPPDNAVSFLETAGKAAVAGVSDINTAVGALSVGLNAYNLDASEAGRVSDALFMGVKLGVTTFGELGSSLGKVAGIASSSGATIEDTVATLAQITTKGFSTSEAVTALKASFVSLSKPSKEVQAALEAQGFESAKAAIEAEGLGYVLQMVRDVADETGKPLINLVGSAEAVNAVLATTGENWAAASEKARALQEATGATADAFDLISDTPAQKIAVFKAQIEAAKIAVGDAFLPALGSLLEAVTPLVEKLGAFARETLAPMAARFSEMPEPARQLTAVMGGLAVAGGTVAAGLTAVMGVVGPLVSGMGLLGGAAGAGGAAAGVGTLGSSAGGLGGALGVLTGPLGWAVGLTAALGIAAFKASAAQRAQFEAVNESGGAFGSYVEAARAAREEAGLFGRIGFFARDAWASFKDVLTNLLGLLAPLGSMLKGAGEAVGGVLGSLGEKIGLDLSFPEPSEVGAIRDATMAYLEMNKGYDATILKSSEFKSAQAEAALQLEQGTIGSVEYKNALEAAAGAIARRTAEAQLDAEAAATQSSAYADLTDGATQYSSVMVDANGQIITAAQQRAAAEADAAQAATDAYAADLQRLVNRSEMEQATADSLIASRQRAVDNMVEGLAITQSGYDAERAAMLAMADGGAEALGFLGSSHQTATNIITTGQKQMQGEFAATGSAGATSFGSLDETLTDTAAGMVAGAADIEGATTTVRDAFGNIVPGAQQLSAGVGGALDAVIPKVSGFADETERAAQAQARAQGEAVGAAEDFGAGTVDSFAGVSDQAVDTTGQVGELQVALESLPPEVQTAYILNGVPQAREMIAQVNADLQGIAETIRFSLVGTYVGTGGAEKNSPMAVLTDIWALRDEAGMSFDFAGTYSAGGAMEWRAGALAITGGVEALREQAKRPIELRVDARIDEALQLLLFDADYEAAALQAAQEKLENLGLEAAEAARMLGLAQAALDSFTPGVLKEIDDFFSMDFQGALDGASGALGSILDEMASKLVDGAPELKALLEQLRSTFTLDAGFFGDYGILDPETMLPFTSMQGIQDRIRELFNGTPEQQAQARDLWESLTKGLDTALKSAVDRGVDSMEEYRQAIGPDSPTGQDLKGLFLKIAEVMEGAHERLSGTLEDETGEVETQLEIYDRLAAMVADRAKAEADAQRAIEQANRELERQIKDRQKAAEEAEKLAHDQVMQAIEDEMDAREDAYDREMRQLDKREAALEAEVERLTKAEEDRHAKRMAAITAETDAEQARIDQATEALDYAEALLKTLENGDALSDADRNILEAMGIDPDKIRESNEGLNKTRRLVDALNKLISDLPSERAYTTLDQAQRDALQQALDQGLIPDEKKRVVEVALAGGRIRGDVLREILSKVVKDSETQVEQAESYLDIVRQQLAAEKDRLDLAEMTNARNREALQGQIDAENERHQAYLDQQADRLAAIDAERDALQENYRVWKEAADKAKDAQRDAHDARMEQLQREYALQLLSLGKSPEEVARILQEQAERAAKIADEAQARFRDFLAQLEAARRELEGEAAMMPGGAGVVRGGSAIAPPGVPVPGLPPGNPGIPGPGDPVTSDWLGAATDGADAAGRALRSGFFDPTLAGMRSLMLVAGQTNEAMMALSITAGRFDLGRALSSGARIDVEQNTDNRRVNVGVLNVGAGDPVEEGILDAIGVFTS